MLKTYTSEESGRPIRKFNPGALQSDEEIIRQFVVRQREFNIVLEVLIENISAPCCQHMLIVAPRGRGKTMLLARIAAELRTNEKLAQGFIPVSFMEESHEIFTLADFWLEVLFQFAQESAARETDLANDLRASHAAFVKRWREENLEDAVRATVLEASDRLDRRLVLMVENLQELCQNVDDDFGWKLRKTLQTDPQIMLLATATSRFKGLDNAEHSFFELFRIVNLEPLPTLECKLLWEMASGDGTTKRDMRPLEILTGGSPRLLVIIAGIAWHGSLQQLMEELVSLIDDHTEYFRGNIGLMAKTERRVFIAAIDLWQPSSSGEIAARARLDVRIASTMLKRLVDRGALIQENDGRGRRYVAAERLYCIYYKLRRERGEASIVQNLIRFMSIFYGETELANFYENLNLEASASTIIQEGMERAMAIDPLVVGPFSDYDSLEIDSASREKLIRAVDLLSRGCTQWDEDKDPTAISTLNGILKQFDSKDLPDLQEMVVLALFHKARISEELGDNETVWSVCKELVFRFEKHCSSEHQFQFAWSLITLGLQYWKLNDTEEAMRTSEEVIARFGSSHDPYIQQLVALMLVILSRWQAELRQFEAATETSNKAVMLFGSNESPELQSMIVKALSYKLPSLLEDNDFEEVKAICDEIEGHFGLSDKTKTQEDFADALAIKCLAQGKLAEYEAALTTSRKIVELFGSSESQIIQIAVVVAILAQVEFQTIEGQPAVALHDYQMLQQRLDRLSSQPNPQLDPYIVRLQLRSMWARAQALLANNESDLAFDTLRAVYSLFDPANDGMMEELLEQIPTLIARGAPAHLVLEILKKNKAKSETLAPLLFALQEMAGEPVRAPTEVLEVAADVLARIESRKKILDP